MPRPNRRATTLTRQSFALLLGLALLSSAAAAESSLTPHSAEYKVKIKVLGGKLTTELRSTETGFIATHVIRPTGLSRLISRGTLTETSQFAIADESLRPIEYSSKDTISRDKTDASIRFDWDAGEARGMVNGEELVSAMNALAHDRVSIQYELMHDLLNQGPSDTYTMFEIDRLRIVNVRSIGTRSVKVPAGRFEAVGIQHQSEGSDRVTTLWCVEALDFLPVIIEQHKNGKLRVRATLKKYSPVADSQSVRLER